MSTVQGRRVWSARELAQPGDFYLQMREDAPGKANFFYKCPCGCNGRHESGEDDEATQHELIYIALGAKLDHYWQWDGNLEAPTLHPSIWSKTENGGCGWHGFLEKGVWRSV